MENSLPKGWIKVELQYIAAKTNYPIGDGDHGQIKPSMYKDNGIPYIRVSDIGWGIFKPENLVFIDEETHNRNLKSELVPGDVLIAKTGATIGKCCIVPENIRKANTTSSVGKITLETRIVHPKWLLNFFLTREFKDFMWSISERTAQPGFNIRDMVKFKIPLPPKSEHDRILKLLDDITPRIECNRQRLDKIPQLLKRFRQSVLAAAVSGRLTEAWREIAVEQIPLRDLIEDLKYGTSQKSEKGADGIPILRIPNIGDDGRIIKDDLKYANLPQSEYEKLRLKAGDILLIRSNGSVSLLGRTALVSTNEEGYAYAGYLIRIRCNKNKMIPEFLNLVFSSYDLRIQIEMPSRSSSGVNNINSDEVKALKVPYFTIEEQKKIVNTVEHLFAFADMLETRYAKAKAMLDRLPQAILSKAFRGELVPQDLNDEPASLLLERIKAEKENLGTRKVTVRNK